MSSPPQPRKKHGKSLFHEVGLAAISSTTATLCTHPIDTLKLRAQLRGLSGPSTPLLQMSGLYAGLSPAVLRAVSYSATRLGLYGPLRARLAALVDTDAAKPPLSVKVAASVMSGAFGAVLGNPCELLKVRMQHARDAISSSPASATTTSTATATTATTVTTAAGAQQPREGLVAAVRGVVRDGGGVRALWTGTTPNAMRGAFLTAAQLAMYDHAKTVLAARAGMTEGVRMHVAAAMVAGLVATTVSTPADVVKSLVMHSRPTRSPANAVAFVFRTDGLRGFMRGWVGNYARLGPNSLITVVVYERLRTTFGLENI